MIQCEFKVVYFTQKNALKNCLALVEDTRIQRTALFAAVPRDMEAYIVTVLFAQVHYLN
jgi:hypothetical protein